MKKCNRPAYACGCPHSIITQDVVSCSYKYNYCALEVTAIKEGRTQDTKAAVENKPKPFVKFCDRMDDIAVCDHRSRNESGHVCRYLGFGCVADWYGLTQTIGNQSRVQDTQVGTDKITAPDLLYRAEQIMRERGRQYDKPTGERSMGKCIEAFNAITGRDLNESEGWLLLQVLKDVRQWQRPGYHQDSAEDCIAYAALKAEAKQDEQ